MFLGSMRGGWTLLSAPSTRHGPASGDRKSLPVLGLGLRYPGATVLRSRRSILRVGDPSPGSHPDVVITMSTCDPRSGILPSGRGDLFTVHPSSNRTRPGPARLATSPYDPRRSLLGLPSGTPIRSTLDRSDEILLQEPRPRLLPPGASLRTSLAGDHPGPPSGAPTRNPRSARRPHGRPPSRVQRGPPFRRLQWVLLGNDPRPPVRVARSQPGPRVRSASVHPVAPATPTQISFGFEEFQQLVRDLALRRGGRFRSHQEEGCCAQEVHQGDRVESDRQQGFGDQESGDREEGDPQACDDEDRQGRAREEGCSQEGARDQEEGHREDRGEGRLGRAETGREAQGRQQKCGAAGRAESAQEFEVRQPGLRVLERS